MDQFENRATAEIPESTELAPVSKAKSGKSPTQEVYAAYEKAFNALNRDLFAGELPHPFKTLRGNKSSDGHVWPGRFEDQEGNPVIELAVRPAAKDADPQDLLGGLTHQMLRVWQQTLGSKKPSRPNYHNREFADKAKEIGLSVSVPGGREGQVTGDRVELAAIPGGAFEKAVARLLRTGWEVPLREVIEASGPEKRGGQRKKMVCPRCEDNVLTTDAEPECGRCRKETGEIYPMVEESEFVAQGGSFELSDEQRKERRQARRKAAKVEPDTKNGAGEGVER
jgi:hypothetical protein